MKEDGAAVAFDAGSLVMVGGYHHIIGLVAPPESFVSLARRRRDHAVVLAMRHVFTPGLGGLADFDAKSCAGPGETVRPKVDILQVPNANGARAIAFALAVAAAAAAEEAGKCRVTKH